MSGDMLVYAWIGGVIGITLLFAMFLREKSTAAEDDEEEAEPRDAIREILDRLFDLHVHHKRGKAKKRL